MVDISGINKKGSKVKVPLQLYQEFSLSDGSKIKFPYRINLEDNETTYCTLSANEKLIYDCIFTRHCNGYIREKHLKRILKEIIPEWCIPYIISLSSEYIIEIIDIIFKYFNNKDDFLINEFCIRNKCNFKRLYQRMVSYWNEFYRKDYYRINNYVGYKLFKNCWLPNTNIEKL